MLQTGRELVVETRRVTPLSLSIGEEDYPNAVMIESDGIELFDFRATLGHQTGRSQTIFATR